MEADRVPDSQRPLLGTFVLVVDDNEDNREMLCLFLRSCGAAAFGAPDAAKALSFLNIARFDVLISDISMPEIDGHDLIRSVRKLQSANRDIFAIALTGVPMPEQKSLEAGFDVHILKPSDIFELCQLIASHEPRHQIAP